MHLQTLFSVVDLLSKTRQLQCRKGQDIPIAQSKDSVIITIALITSREYLFDK